MTKNIYECMLEKMSPNSNQIGWLVYIDDPQTGVFYPTRMTNEAAESIRTSKTQGLIVRIVGVGLINTITLHYAA
jgi:hypothetical protein